MVLKRAATFGIGLIFTGALAACSGGGPEESAPQAGQDAQEKPDSIENPKDVSGPELCDLLPPETARSLNLNPQGEVDDSPDISSDSPEACEWKSEDNRKSVALSPMLNRPIQEIQANEAGYVDYEELTIAGHPAVRANKGDPAQDGWCAMYVGTADDQLLYGFSLDESKTNPCGMTQKALEASVPTLPAAG